MIDIANWSWPQIVHICLVLVGLGIAMSEHGEPKTGRNNFWASFIAAAVGFAILLFGGFFA